MTYSYAYPSRPITEAEAIKFATTNEHYTPNRSPYTSPQNMVKIAKYYTNDISTGRVFSSGQGLSLLIQTLRSGEPVVIDVLSNFQDPESEAHFIVITGISTDSNREDAIVIHYNDPLSGTGQPQIGLAGTVFGMPGTRIMIPAVQDGGWLLLVNVVVR